MTELRFDTRVKRAMSCGFENGFHVEILAPGSGFEIRPMTLRNKLKLGAGFSLGRIAGQRALNAAYWQLNSNKAVFRKAMEIRPDLIHSHDWDTLPIAIEIKKRTGIPVIYDTHEYARGMHHERAMWRRSVSPAIAVLENSHAAKADQIVTVSEGIATRLHRDLALSDKPIVVRNIPQYHLPKEQDNYRNNGNERSLLLHYHGILAAGRGIEVLTKALANLPLNYRLQLVGPERQRGFSNKIQSLAVALGVEDRLEILPPVHPDQLIDLAAQADFGFCILENNNPHYSFALPNKLFEYMMAGLYVITSDGPDMAELITGNNAGSSISGRDATELADLVKSVSIEELEKTRLMNLKSAKTLCWENEQQKLAKIYQRLLSN